MINATYIYLDTRPGFGPFSAESETQTTSDYLSQLVERFNKSNDCAGTCSTWGLAQTINQLNYQLKNNHKVVTVLGPERFVSAAMIFLRERLPAYSDSFYVLTSGKNNND